MSIWNKTTKRGLLPALYKIKQWFLTPQANVINAAAINGAYEYLLRYNTILTDNQQVLSHFPKTIWTLWLQSEQQAPIIVQQCLHSIRQQTFGYQLHILNEHNIYDHITIPEYIIRKYQQQIISRTHFSDIVRLLLLEQYGGVWIDATFYMTAPLPEYITSQPLFVYQNLSSSPIQMSNCFIAAAPHHPIIKTTLLNLLQYWQHEDRLVSYSIFHLFWAMAIRSNPQLNTLYQQVPFVPADIRDVLCHELSKPYSEQRMTQIKQLSPIHKLTYKFDEFGIDIKTKGTFYDVLINHNTPTT